MVAVRSSRLSKPCHVAKGGLVLARNDDAAKELGALGAWALVPSATNYEPKINSRTVQGRGLGPECGRKEEKPTAAQIL